MKHLLRALMLAAVVGTALALTGSAFAAFTTPRLAVNKPTAGSVTIGYTQTREDDALFRLQIYVPLGYTPALTAAPGSTIGAVTAVVQANAISADAIVPLNGTIRVDSPTAATHNEPSDLACRGSAAPINTVWVHGAPVADRPARGAGVRDRRHGRARVGVRRGEARALPPVAVHPAVGGRRGARREGHQRPADDSGSAHGPDGRRDVRLARDRDAVDGRRRNAERAGHA